MCLLKSLPFEATFNTQSISVRDIPLFFLFSFVDGTDPISGLLIVQYSCSWQYWSYHDLSTFADIFLYSISWSVRRIFSHDGLLTFVGCISHVSTFYQIFLLFCLGEVSSVFPVSAFCLSFQYFVSRVPECRTI